MSCASKMSLTVKITYIGSQLVQLYNGTKALDVGSEQIICKWGKKKRHTYNYADYWLHTAQRYSFD